MSSDLSAPTFDDICAARSRLQNIIIRTPLLKFDYEIPGIEIYLKCETFQPTSSFKIRGAANIVKILSAKQKENGIVVPSSGNMAQGLSYIAKEENLKCRILVPDTTNEAKLNAIKRYGGEITKCSFDEWFQVLISGQCPMLDGHFIHPVRETYVMAGHGTMALEILEDLPDCDAILVPYGGGGLITGIAAVVKYVKESIDIFACEIETAAPLSAALNAGKVVEIPIRKTWIDAIGHTHIMKEMWPLVKDSIDGSIVVSLKETADALKLLIERSHFICEGASATALAAAIYHYADLLEQGKAGLRRKHGNKPIKIVAVISGAGIDNETVIKCLNKTL